MSTSATQKCMDDAIKPCWTGVLTIALGAFTLVVTEFLPIGLLPGIIKGLGVSEGTAGLTVTVAAAFGFLAAPATVLLVGRIDRRVVLLSLSALVIVSSVMSSLATDFPTLLIARMIIGIGVGGFWSVSITAASRLVPEDKVHKASSLVFAGISIASVVSIPAASYIAAHYSWRVAFMAASALAIVVFVVQFFALPAIEAKQGVTVRDFVGLLKSRKVVAIYLAIVFIVSGQFCGYTFVSPYLQQLARFNPNTISAALLGYGVLSVAGNFIAGELAGRDLHKTVYGNVVLFLGSLIAIAALPHHFTIAIISLLCWALSWGMAPVGTQLWLYKSTQHAPEAAQSMNTSVFQLSITLGSLIGGVVVDHIDLHASMWTGAAIFGLAVVMVIVVGRMDALDERAQ